MFKPYTLYNVALLSATLLLGGKLTWLVLSAKASGSYDRTAVFLFASLFVLALFAFLYLLSYSVTVREDTLTKKTVFGVKEINFTDLIDLSVIDMKSRFIIFLISNDKVIMLSSLLSNFMELTAFLRRGASSYNARWAEDLDKITDRKVAIKHSLLKIALALALLLIIAMSVKR